MGLPAECPPAARHQGSPRGAMGRPREEEGPPGDTDRLAADRPEVMAPPVVGRLEVDLPEDTDHRRVRLVVMVHRQALPQGLTGLRWLRPEAAPCWEALPGARTRN